MRKILVQSPTRVDLAGGTLDLWPLYNFTGGAKTINLAMDIMTTAEICEHEGPSIELVSQDLQFSKSYTNLSECLNDSDSRISLLQSQIRYWQPKRGFKLLTKSESPLGGGLGGSSSLTVSLLKAFSQFCERPFQNTHQLVNVAHNIEAQVLNTPTGTQDYYPAASGGINILRYNSDGIEQEILDDNTDVFLKHSILVYTGKSHHSGINNFEVLTRAVNKDPQTLKALFAIKEIADETVDAVKDGNWYDLPQLFRKEYDSRIRLAKAFSSPEIEKLSEVSLQAGAAAVKICGAGGGGCVLVWADPDKTEKVKTACQESGFQVLGASPVKKLPN